MQIIGAGKDDALAGFAVIIRDRATSFYLHGGTEREFRHLSPSDFLLREAIDASKSAGSTCFNFMASPPGQPMLVRYKEKWGAQTRQLRTYTLPNSPLFPVFVLAEKAYRVFS
jgi:lipid II:glycine glycyltransferase (peptidoglycan interpeptide bridge formation enzyme)